MAGHDARVGALAPGTNQPFELANADPHTFGGLTPAQPTFQVLTHQMRTLTLVGAHFKEILWTSNPRPTLRPNRDILILRGGDIPLWG
jgi:hypothetical protein